MIIPNKIRVSSNICAGITRVWQCWNEPKHIIQWAFASEDWEASAAENDLRVDGRFKTTMAAKDKTASFDFCGTYTQVISNRLIAYKIDDGRFVSVEFAVTADGVEIAETFETENLHSKDMQRARWQSILNHFKNHVENCQ